MKILSVSLENFASYENLDFDFQDAKGMTLIHGATGSGKSTLCDTIPWIIFGTTAKGGAVNEILAWPGDKVTVGAAIIDLGGHGITVVRKRGKAKDNDLYWIEANHRGLQRGKDIPDTQRLIEQRLNITADSYLAGAYYHEFSQTAQFFTTNPKNRRQLTEQIVDLALAKKLTLGVSEQLKVLKKTLTAADFNVSATERAGFTLSEVVRNATAREAAWEKDHANKIEETKQKSANFSVDKEIELKKLTQQFHDHSKQTERDIALLAAQHQELLANTMLDTYYEDRRDELIRAKIESGSDRCPECGGQKNHEDHDLLVTVLRELETERKLSDLNKAAALKADNEIAKLKEARNPYRQMIKDVTRRENPYKEMLMALRLLNNPYLRELQKSRDDYEANRTEMTNAKLQVDHLKEKVADFELLADIIADFRSELVKGTIVGLETQTNNFLAGHFDAEIRVIFSVQDADKLEVSITKDGNQCVFTQLSKGQRQLLKLAFGVSVMKQVSNHSGVTTNAVFFDEATDGLDELMKMKAYKLLESLTADYESVFLVDHSPELKAMVPNQYQVSLVNGRSQIEKA